jgi:hypothetical protein
VIFLSFVVNSFNSATLYWSACSKRGKWLVMYSCVVLSIVSVSTIWFWNCSTVWYYYFFILFSLLSYIYIVFNLMCHLIGLLWKLEKVSIARPTALSSVSSCRGEGVRSLYEEELLRSNVECLTVNHSEWRVWSGSPSLHCKYLSGFIFFL